VVWTSYYRDDSGPGVFARRFDAGGEFRVNGTTEYVQDTPRIAVHPSHGFTIAWRRDDYETAYTMARRFESNGDALAGELEVSAPGTGAPCASAIASDGAHAPGRRGG